MKEPIVVRSPGRINLLGEHTDYMGGIVLPAAINKYVTVSVARRDDESFRLFAVQFNERVHVNREDLQPVKNHWQNYVMGVVDQLIKRGHKIDGFNMTIDGDLPTGAGLSSSAAMQCAVCFALNELFSLGLSKREMAEIARSAEHAFAGVQCGIMDPFASLFGKENHAIRLDCKTLKYDYLPLDLADYKIVLLNTNVKHNLAASEYNKRKQECEEGLRLIQKKYPQISSLLDASLEILLYAVSDPVILKRCAYVISENNRVISACGDLKSGDLTSFGQKMFATHGGLSKEFEVSCPELDFLVDAVKNNPHVLGARMMGGGFGGCTINIIKENVIDELTGKINRDYEKAMGRSLTVYIAETGNGTEIINQKITV